ncbi:MAG: STAS domain-containing protein [Oscillospiraceae bacterium]|nr:STAS domain-containing protein [Oscillospiraceae bacterium]
MDISVTQDGDTTVIAIPEHLDVLTSPFLKNILTDVISATKNVELDFSNTALVSSAGLRVLLQAQKTFQKSEIKMTFENVSPGVMEVFDFTGVSKIFNIV